jgi:hypothetical protein
MRGSRVMKVTTPCQLFVAAMMLAGILAGGIGTAAAQAPTLYAIPGLFNTGVDNNGKLASPGTADLHYKLFVPPDATEKVAVVGGKLDSLWAKPEDTPNSRWIGLGEDLSKVKPAGYYKYQTTFDLPKNEKGKLDLDPNTASITGQVAADDSVEIFLNGNKVNILLNGKKEESTPGKYCGKLFPFKICDGFKQGSNTLEFVVNNLPYNFSPSRPDKPWTPTGLNVQLSGTVYPAR